MVKRCVCFVLALTVVTFSANLLALSQSEIDTARWKVYYDNEWGFHVSVPPDWVKLDMPALAGRRMTLRFDVDSDKKLMCMVFVNADSRTSNMTQQQLNEGMIREGAISPREWEATLRATGQPWHVEDSRLETIMNMPANVFEAFGSFRSMDTHFDASELEAVLTMPGQNVSLKCEATAEAGAKVVYRRWLPTFRAIFASFFIAPHSS